MKYEFAMHRFQEWGVMAHAIQVKEVTVYSQLYQCLPSGVIARKPAPLEIEPA
jgi:hypothetical protein